MKKLKFKDFLMKRIIIWPIIAILVTVLALGISVIACQWYTGFASIATTNQATAYIQRTNSKGHVFLSLGLCFDELYLQRIGFSAAAVIVDRETEEIYLDSEYEGSCTLSEESKAADPLFHLTPMIGFLESVDDRLTELRELFACTDTALLPVYMQPVQQIFSATGKNYGGMYYPCGGNSYVEASSIYVLTHEYVHYLDDLTGTGDDSWCGEVLAVYYQKDMTYLSRCVSAGFGASITIEWLTEIIGQPYDSVEDEILFQHIMTAHEENPRYSLISLYNGRLSFGDYFVQTYGEPVFIDCMLQPEKTILHTGFTMDEIVEQWCGWLEQFKS